MFATVCAVDKQKGLVKVNHLGRVSAWLPCVGATPAINQQVAFLEVEDGSGVVFGSTARVDGKAIMLHIGSIDIKVDGEEVEIKAKKYKFTGDFELKGNLAVDGQISTTKNVIDSRGDLTNFKTTDGAKRA